MNACEICGGPIRKHSTIGVCKRNATCFRENRHRKDKQFKKAHPLRNVHHGVVQRCTNPNRWNYHNYGGRGINVFPDWLGPGGAERFETWILANLGPRPEGHSLDRIDNEGDYEPGNLQWATLKEQAKNRRPGSCGAALIVRQRDELRQQLIDAGLRPVA